MLLILSYSDAMNENLQWISIIREYLENMACLAFLLTRMKTNPFFIHKKLFQTLSDTFHQNAFETINNVKSKLRTYAIFKKDSGFEKYLSNIKNPTRRAILTKFRLSNHKLMIEVGRYTNITKEMRFCHFCPNMVEIEAHFLFYCIAYKPIRATRYDSQYIEQQF